MFLPPAKSDRQVEYEKMMNERRLSPEEAVAYQSLVVERESRFWQRDGISVEEALSGVKRQRKQRLAEILEQRGASKEEVVVFFMVLERDHPKLLEDRE
jgi:hypothetical protein